MQKLLLNRWTLLWFLCLVGSWAALPYVHYLGVIPPTVSMGTVFLHETIESALAFALILWLSSKLIPKTDLHPFLLSNLRTQILYPALISGIALGILLYLLEKTIFKASVLANIDPPPFWAGILASIRGGVNEEVLLRLFLFTLIYFLFRKLASSRTPILWVTNVLVAVLFGAAHLPFLYRLTPDPTSFEISRVLILNSIPGLVFGYLYFTRGIWAAIASHFVTDLMIHAFLV